MYFDHLWDKNMSLGHMDGNLVNSIMPYSHQEPNPPS